MSGERPFDDDRWPDFEGFACCFLCGRRVDPLDPHRGAYTSSTRDCESLPIHIPCIVPYFSREVLSPQVDILFRTAIAQMTDANVKAALRNANVNIVPAMAH